MTDILDYMKQLKKRVKIEDYAAAYLTPSPQAGKDMYCCPVCGSGTRPGGDGAFHVYKNTQRAYCHAAGCEFTGDIFDVAGVVIGSDSKADQYNEVARFAGQPTLPPTKGKSRAKADTTSLWDSPVTITDKPVEVDSSLSADQPTDATTNQDDTNDDKAETKAKEAEKIQAWRDAMTPDCEGYSYLVERGFNDEDIRQFKFGYDKNRRRLVIPWQSSEKCYYHTDRAVYECSHKERYLKPAGLTQPVLNPIGEDIFKEPAFLIVEGSLDVYAALACGIPAMATAGASKKKYVDCIVSHKYDGIVILAADNDKGGVKLNNELCDELTTKGIKTYKAKYPKGYKDVCDIFAESREKCTQVLHGMIESRYEGVLETFNVHTTANALESVTTLEKYREPYSTGLSALDYLLNGGLRPGLTTIGAQSSLGKTTLCHQIAEHMAGHGTKVLFVSVEQSADELVTKSLSRIMSQQNPDKPYIGAQDLIDPRVRDKFDDDHIAMFDKARATYANVVQPNMYIMEPDDQPSALDITAAAKAIKDCYGVAPVVFVDYLQLLAAQDEHDTDKRAVDTNVLSLRQLARELNTPVVCISSLNRASYAEGVSMSSFKESGAVEYGSDVLLGLQPYHLKAWIDNVIQKVNGSKGEDEPGISKATATEIVWNEFRKKSTRECGVVMLKNRNGRYSDDEAHLDFMCVANRFVTDPSSRRHL